MRHANSNADRDPQPAAHVLITGMSGVGKSTVLEALQARGHRCIDMDQAGWSYEGEDGHQHWRIERLEQALAEAHGAPIIVCGCAEEQTALRHHFRSVILLHAPRDVILARLATRAGNAFGKHPAERARILADIEQIEPLLRRACTDAIETTMPLEQVIERVCACIRRGE